MSMLITPSRFGAAAPSITFANYIASLSPVAWWRMGDAVGSAYLNDAVANEHATLQGTYTLGVPGLVASDSDAAVQLVSGASCAYTSASSKWALGTGDYSAIIIAKWTTSTVCTVAACRDSTNDGVLFVIVMNIASGTITVQAQGASAGQAGTSGSVVYNDGNVHVIGIEQKASTRELSLYVDGVFKVTVVQATARPVPTSANVTIGANIGKNQNFIGTADECALFNTLLSSTQMANISSLVHTGHL